MDILERVDPNILRGVFLQFPPPETANEHGVLGFSSDLDTVSLLKAYSMGIFPWPFDEDSIPWMAPWERGVIDLKNYRVPARVQRYYRSIYQQRNQYQITCNRDFVTTIQACAAMVRPGSADTWITTKLMNAYERLHSDGFAYSIEVWNSSDQLVGGLFGVCIAGIVSAESMFALENNVGKFALIYLLQHLSGTPVTLLDIQMVTSVTSSFGGVCIPQAQYNQYVATARELPLDVSGLNPG